MALTVEQLKVVIEGETSGLSRQLSQISGKLSQFGTTATNVGKQVQGNLFNSMLQANVIGNIITNTLGKLTSATTGFTREVLAGGSALSRLRIANQVVTANLGMTSEAVQQLRRDLAEANTYGVAAEQVISSLALSGLMDLAKNLQYVDGRTGQATKGVTALTLAIKDLSAARGIDSLEGIQRVSNFLQRGEASLAQGLIEIGEINREYAGYAQTIGKTTDTLTAQEKAQVRLDIVMRESAKSFGAYAATYNSSGKIFSSVGMLITGIAQEIGSRLEPVLRVGSLAFLEFFRGIQSAVFGAGNAIENFANRVAGYMVAVIRLIGRLGSTLPILGAGFRALANFTLQPIKAQGNLQNALSDTGDAMGQTAKDAGKLQKELMGLASFDELNVLSAPADSSTAGSPIIGGGGVTTDFGGATDFKDTTAEIMKYATQAESVFNKIGESINSILAPLRQFKILGTPVLDILLDMAKYAGVAFLAFKLLAPVISLIGILASPLLAVFGGLGTILGTLSGPVVLIGAGLAVIAGVLYSLWENSEGFRSSVSETFAIIQEVVGQIGTIFIDFIQQLQIVLQPLINSIGNLLGGAFNLLGQIVNWLWINILKPLIEFIATIMVPILQIVIGIVTGITKSFVDFVTPIIDLVIPVLTFLWETFTKVFEDMRRILENLWNNTLKPIFTAIWDFISGFIIPIFQLLFKVAQNVWNGLRSAVESAWSAIWGAIKPVIDWFEQNVLPIIKKVAEGIAGAFNVLKSILEGIWNGIVGTIKSVINWIIDKINGFIRGINGMIDGLASVAGAVGIDVSFRVGEIPRLATGGIVGSPTLAMLGEQGYSEAVLPLERNTQWADRIAELINNANGGGGQTVVVQLGDEKIFEKFIDFVNEKSTATGMTVLNI